MPSTSVAQLDEKIKRYLTTRNGSALRRLLTRHNFADIAEVLESLPPEDLVTCFQYLNIGQAAQVLTSLDQERQIACLSSLPTMMSSQILRFMPSDDAVDLLQELDTQQSQKILKEMPFDEETRTIHHLMMEEEDTAAGIMSADFLQVPVDATVGDAQEMLKQAEEKDFIYYIYLADVQEQLVGVVSLKQLILHPPETPLQKIAQFEPKYVLLTEDQELVVKQFRKYYNLLAIPVVDDRHVIQGIITLDDIIDIIDEESSEDIYLASGISLEQIDEKNLLTGPMINAVKARMPWLMVTLVGQFLAAAVIASHSHTVATAVKTISFMPLLSGLSGNMGTQSETIAVRGLALNLITPENFKEKFVRELGVGLITGFSFAVGVAVLSFVQHRHWELSILLFCAVIFAVCLSAILGIALPYTYNALTKKDPAGVGGPLITTLLDILTFSVFLYVVSLFLNRMI